MLDNSEKSETLFPHLGLVLLSFLLPLIQLGYKPITARVFFFSPQEFGYILLAFIVTNFYVNLADYNFTLN